MGNILKETMAKVAANVTQSVVSAVIVFLITTYLLVDAGKKEEAKEKAEKQAEKTADSLRHQTPAMMEPLPAVKSGQSGARPEGTGSQIMKPLGNVAREPNAQKVTETGGKQPAGQLPVTTAPEKKGEAFREQPIRSAAGRSESEVQEPQAEPLKTPVVKKEERSVTDTLEEKKPKDKVQKVKKRADDVFDELDQEAQKQPPH